MTQKKEKTPDFDIDDTGADKLWTIWNLGGACAATANDVSGLTFNMNLSDSSTAGTFPPTHDEKMLLLLTDIWHNQATIIKWLSKIAENTKKANGSK